jgi:hypothetical protein
MLAACGGGSSSQENAGTSALSFQVLWDRPDFQRASLTDCADVASVGAFVYSDAGELLGAGGPWDCATGSGVISGLPSNYYATITVAGYGPDGTLLYYGQSASIFLTPGSVDAGVITAGAFVPALVSPNNAATVAMDALVLQWNPLPGASGYRVILATDSSFAPESILRDIAIDGGDVTATQVDSSGLGIDQVYYWRVQALSDVDQGGLPSETRILYLDQVVVTSVTFVGDDPGGVQSPIQTTVVFNYTTIAFSQQQEGAVIVQWSAVMDSNDYFDLQGIITSYELMGQSDITYTPAPCAGWSGLDVSMVYNATTYGFSISPGVCNPAEWGTGVSSLVALKDNLVAKYQP